MEKYMKNYVSLSLLLIVTCVLFGREKPVKNSEPNSPSMWIKEARKLTESNSIETFDDAFKDPNVFIGVFERPELSHTTTLSSGEILEKFPGYWEAIRRYNLNKLRCVKAIKGEPFEPVVLVPTFLYIYRSLYEQPPIPPFIPLRESKWVLALRKTSKEYRIERFGEEIEKYKFLNDRTMFALFRYGHGALCLKWPEEKTEPRYVVKMPETIVEDLEAIQNVVAYAQKENPDPNEIAALNRTSEVLKTKLAKSVFEKLLSDESEKVQDPNNG